MTLGDKLSRLRRENNYTQEQLADILGVSRQAISKWESDTTYPETEKLLKLGELYDCSMDYLLKNGDYRTDSGTKTITLNFNKFYFERKSKKCINGLPLWHINIGLGRTAKGIIAVGLMAKGIVSIGLFSVGIISIGLLSVGLLALGDLAIGLLPIGVIAAGIIAVGAISVGVVSVGALSIGLFSAGAMAIGKYFAMGDSANALIALGKTTAIGGAYQKLGVLSDQDIVDIKNMLDTNTPWYFAWAKEIIKLFLQSVR